jgi:hypothetical protein
MFIEPLSGNALIKSVNNIYKYSALQQKIFLMHRLELQLKQAHRAKLEAPARQRLSALSYVQAT